MMIVIGKVSAVIGLMIGLVTLGVMLDIDARFWASRDSHDQLTEFVGDLSVFVGGEAIQRGIDLKLQYERDLLDALDRADQEKAQDGRVSQRTTRRILSLKKSILNVDQKIRSDRKKWVGD